MAAIGRSRAYGRLRRGCRSGAESPAKSRAIARVGGRFTWFYQSGLCDIRNFALGLGGDGYNPAPKENPVGLPTGETNWDGHTVRRQDVTAETSKKKATTKVAASAAPKAAAVKTPVKAAAKKVAAQPPAAAAPAVSPAHSTVRSATTPPLAAAPVAAKPTSTKAMPSTISAPTAAVLKRDPKLANNWKTKTAEELSDAEVIAMPDDEYMNDKQMAFFRHKLVQLKQDMHNNAGETAENLREDTVVVPDPADRATIEEEHALELRTRDRERKLLKKIEQSIARIDAGDYGYCDETGEPIGVGRLLARPTATLSLEAQQRRELKQKMFGD